MIFNQHLFLFAFLPILVVLFYTNRFRRYRIPLLVLASFLFYGVSGAVHLMVLIFDIVAVYWLTKKGERVAKLSLFLAIAIPLTSLAYFKYSHFLLSDVLGITSYEGGSSFSLFQNILLPAGISFFTFQVISYAIDRYRGRFAAPPFFDFMFYVSFFPQLVAGPIVRFPEMGPQIRRLTQYAPSSETILTGITYFAFGLAFKVLIADSLGNLIGPLVVDLERLSVIDSYLVLFSYSFQIYFDFYGYSLIAIGLGICFGIQLPANFKRPYEADSPKDFWRKWHVSLSFWIRDYLYIPLGGGESYIRNIVIIFLACGLWHGAGWNFIAWGAYHAVLVLTVHYFEGRWKMLPKLIRKIITFILVSLGWTLFLFDFDEASVFVGTLLSFHSSETQTTYAAWLVLATAFLVCFKVNVEDIADRAVAISRQKTLGVGYGVMIFLCIVMLDYSDDFIYFRF